MLGHKQKFLSHVLGCAGAWLRHWVVLLQSDRPLWGIENKKCAIYFQAGGVGYLHWVEPEHLTTIMHFFAARMTPTQLHFRKPSMHMLYGII